MLKWLADEKRAEGAKGFIGFSISADMSRELTAVCAAVPQSAWELLEDRESETVHVTEVELVPGNYPKTIRLFATSRSSS